MVHFEKENLRIDVETVAPVETYFDIMHAIAILINRAANDKDNDDEAKEAISAVAYWLCRSLSQVDVQMLRHMGDNLSEVGARLNNSERVPVEQD